MLNMNKDQGTFLTKAGLPSAVGRAAVSTILPPVLLRQAPGRLRLLCLIFLAVQSISWIGVNVLEGEFLGEFERLHDWVPGTLSIVISLIVFFIAGNRQIRPQTLITIGLIYQVIISYCVAFLGYWGVFLGLTPDAIVGDRIGLQPVAIWMISFSFVFPTKPARALPALLSSAFAIPIVIALSIKMGQMPVLEPHHFFLVFVLPYLICVAVAYFTVQRIYQLGLDVRRAREMGSYRLESLLGRGGMGEVWKARHAHLARPAAVKLIRPNMLGGDPAQIDKAISRFEREAQVTASLQSPHSVELYDFGASDDGTLFLVMELLDGIDLQSMVERFGPLSSERVVHILVQVCASLSEAHRRGLVHRDIKPANIFLCKWAFEHDFVKVLDFGLVKHRSQNGTAEQASLTGTTTIIGTPSYLAPELALDGQNLDGRSDIYSLGCVAYWLLTGKQVFEAESPMAMLMRHATVEPEPPSARLVTGLPRELDDIVLSCLAKDPTDRPKSVGELATRLSALDIGPRWTSERAADWWHGIDTSVVDEEEILPENVPGQKNVPG